MKKWIALLLTLCLLLGLLPAAIAEETAALPQVGDVVYGFEVLELREFPLVGAQVVRFEHQATGAELYYIANDDTNRVFDLTFFTDAIDKTGLPHVFEHSTLSGSDKYPSKQLWFNLVYQTYNTYMNAFTMSRMTSYPVASLSEAQLLKYADLYTDCCLHPMIMKDESIYREEAWRYRLADADDALALEGTVYSEMLGAYDLNNAASINALSAAFPGSMIGNEYGGDPAYIPDMTWDMLKDYHDRYYHPSNCAAYLYGAFEDYTAFLKLLDDAFSGYEKREFTRSDEGYAPIEAPVAQALAFPTEAGSSTEHAAVTYYSIVCPGLNADPEQELVLNTLTDLLTNSASDMQQRLKEALPYGSFASFIQTDGPEDAIQFVAQNLNVEDAEIFKATVDAALAEIAEAGFPQDQVDGVMASLTIDTLLAREAADVGVESVIPNMAYAYATSGNPWDYLDYVDALGQMDDWNQQGLYAQAVAEWLIDSATTALVTTYPEPGLKEQQDAELAERLAAVKASMSAAEIAEIVAASNAEAAEDDSSQYVAQLQAVTVESLPEEIKLYDVTDETDEAGVRHIDALASVDGIGHASILLDASGLPQEDIHWFNLYTQLVGELDTEAHAKAELATLMSRYLYDGRVYVSLPESEDGFKPYLRLRWIALDDDLAEGYDLMRELVFDTKVDDAQKVVEQVQALKASLKNSVNSAAYNVILYRAMARATALNRYYSYANYLEYYAFLEEAEQLLAEDPDAAVAKLEGIKAYFDNSTNAVAIYAGNAESIALNRPLADAFLAKLDRREITPVAYDLPVPAASEAVIVDSSVNFNLLQADYEALGMEGYDGGLDAVAALVSDTFLQPLLRDQYGVYSPWHGAMQDGGVYLLTYRDPNVTETFEVYDSLYDLVSGMDVDQETLNGYILSAYAGFAMPAGELSGAVNAALSALEGKDQDEAVAWMRQLKGVTPEAVKAYADMYAKLSAEGVRMTAGAASAVNAHADLYEAILNPFGAQDKSQVTLTDVTEDGAHYEAVRFAYEEGLMLPAAEDAFGVDQPATEGDLLTAVYVLMGGPADAEEALATFAEYGLAGEDDDLSTPVAAEDVNGLLSALVGEAVSYEGDDPLTRGGLAEMLMAFVNELE